MDPQEMDSDASSDSWEEAFASNSLSDTLSLTPQEYAFYEHQVGGHNLLVKPRYTQFVFKPFNANEYWFYKCTDNSFKELKQFTPGFFGVSKIPELEEISEKHTLAAQNDFWKSRRQQKGRSLTYLVLEDLAASMAKPCVMDLKLGLRGRSVRYSSGKRKSQAEKSANTTSASVGFRICGFQTYAGEPFFCDKYVGRSVQFADLCDQLSPFFALSKESDPIIPKHLSCLVVDEFIRQLETLQVILRKLSHVRLWCSSLLFLYDAALIHPAQGDENQENPHENLRKSVTLRLIDFSHATLSASEEIDVEYMFGLENLKVFLQCIKDPDFGLDHHLAQIARPHSRQNEEELSEHTRPFTEDLLI